MNASRLEKRLRFPLSCSTILWRKAKRNCFASVTSDGGQHIIHLPPGYDDDYTLRALLHELCHITIPGELSAFGAFEEEILERVLEPLLMEHLRSCPRKHAWWLNEIRKARPGGAA